MDYQHIKVKSCEEYKYAVCIIKFLFTRAEILCGNVENKNAENTLDSKRISILKSFLLPKKFKCIFFFKNIKF